MSDVTCVRCSKTVPMARADVVGIGYRCDLCSALHPSVESEAADNTSPEQREWLAKQGKRRFFASLGGAGAVVAVPAAIAFAVSGPIIAAMAGLLGFYFGASMIGAATDIHLSQWRRYKQPPLPKATLRK